MKNRAREGNGAATRGHVGLVLDGVLSHGDDTFVTVHAPTHEGLHREPQFGGTKDISAADAGPMIRIKRGETQCQFVFDRVIEWIVSACIELTKKAMSELTSNS